MSDQNPQHSNVSGRAIEFIRSASTRRFARIALIAFALIGLLGFFVAPPVLKSFLLKELSAQLRREVSIDRIEVNPYRLSARVDGLSVRSLEGKEVFGFDSLQVNVSAASLVHAGLVLDGVLVEKPRVAVTRLADGRYDVSDLLDEWMKPSPPGPTPRFSLNNIRLNGGELRFDDRPANRQHVISDILLTVPFVSSLPYDADLWVKPGFSASVNGSPVSLSGQSRPFGAAHESELELEIDNFDLARLQPYLPAGMPLTVSAGTLDAKLQLLFKSQPQQGPAFQTRGNLGLTGFVLKEASGADLLALKQLSVNLEEVDPIRQRYSVGGIALSGLDALVSIDPTGQMNWLRVVDQLRGGAAASPADSAAKGSPVVWQVANIQLDDSMIRWDDRSTGRTVKGDIRDLRMRIGAVDSTLLQPVILEKFGATLAFGELAQGKLELSGTQLDLAKRSLVLDEFTADGIRLKMSRSASGEIEWLPVPVLKKAAKDTGKQPESAPWASTLNKLVVNDLSILLDDHGTSPVARQRVDKLQFSAEGLSTIPGRPGRVNLAARVNEKGQVKLGGNLQLSPLKTELHLETVALPLIPLQPYFTEFLNIALTRGQLSSRGEISLAQEKQDLAASYKGSATLGDLVAVDKLNNTDLLKWKSLYVGKVDFNLRPMSVGIGEIALSDFYARVIVNEAGKLNLSEIVKARAPASASETTGASTVGGASGVSAAKASTPMPVTIDKITLQGGRLNFSDFFVKPNYTVNVTKVGGRVSKLSSAATTPAEMELRGVYANSAPVTITAQLNPLAARAFLDLKAEVTGVDLVPFSPYSGKYAGYNIEKGKLSMNLGYRLADGQLTADNRIFIDQLTFGEKIESPTATSLPVNLAISLLKNNRGEIDLNLPIAGSLDDPQFSIGGLVLKVIGNLFVKAVTSPFALLGSMFGGGEELSNIDFLPGRSMISESAAGKLETLAKALRDRSSLKLEITGRADPETDLEGLKREGINQAVRGEKMKDLTRRGKESGSLDSIDLSEADYPIYLQRAYQAAKFPKPRNVIGLQKDIPVPDMEKLMLINATVSDEDVRQLASRRAETVQGWLIEHGKVPAERIFLLPPKVQADEKSKAARVDFSLK